MESIRNWKVHVLVFVIVVLSEAIGSFKYKLIVLFPMLYAMSLGILVSWPKIKILTMHNREHSSKVLSIMIVLLLVKLGLGIGPVLPELLQAKAALILQEIGHFFGTILLGLPLAVALGMGRESIGATYSIAREGNIAIISEKYGLHSPEGRGVMSMYIAGTLLGSFWLAILAGITAQLDIFHPYALAMGAGVGSGSMMAAATGAIVESYPHLANEIQAYAGAANLMSSILGIWICLFFSLPTAVKVYHWLSYFSRKKASRYQAKEEAL